MSKLSIALIDDHVMMRKGLAALVNEMNEYEVTLECENGKTFIDSVLQKKIQPDIILLDINMPELDGFDTAIWINKNLPLSKIIVLSMFDDEKSIIKMIRLGAKGYVLKDADPEALALALYEVVHKGFHYNNNVNGRLVYAINHNETDIENKHYLVINAKETEFLKLCCSEMTYKEIANIMNLSSRTVEGYRDHLFEKLNIKTRVGLVIYAIKNKLVLI